MADVFSKVRRKADDEKFLFQQGRNRGKEGASVACTAPLLTFHHQFTISHCFSMEKTAQTVVTNMQAFNTEALKARLGALRRYL
jgi:hypothetical protein